FEIRCTDALPPNLRSGLTRVNRFESTSSWAAKDGFVNKQTMAAIGKRLVAVGKHLLGPGILAGVLWYYGPGLLESLRNPLQPGPLLACTGLYTVGVLLTFFRWWILVRAQDLPLTLFNAIRLGLIGFFFSSFLPSSIGGDVVKAAMIAREQ